MIIQVLFLFASCINFKDFHFETSSVYYKISHTYVILVQNFGQLYSICRVISLPFNAKKAHPFIVKFFFQAAPPLNDPRKTSFV